MSRPFDQRGMNPPPSQRLPDSLPPMALKYRRAERYGPLEYRLSDDRFPSEFEYLKACLQKIRFDVIARMNLERDTVGLEDHTPQAGNLDGFLRVMRSLDDSQDIAEAFRVDTTPQTTRACAALSSALEAHLGISFSHIEQMALPGTKHDTSPAGTINEYVELVHIAIAQREKGVTVNPHQFADREARVFKQAWQKEVDFLSRALQEAKQRRGILQDPLFCAGLNERAYDAIQHGRAAGCVRVPELESDAAAFQNMQVDEQLHAVMVCTDLPSAKRKKAAPETLIRARSLHSIARHMRFVDQGNVQKFGLAIERLQVEIAPIAKRKKES